MPSDIADRFVVVRIRDLPTGLFLRWEDDRGFTGEVEPGALDSLWVAFETCLATIRGQVRPSGKIASLPVFVDPTPDIGLRLLSELCPKPLRHELAFVELLPGPTLRRSEGKASPREPIELPLHVVVVGHRGSREGWPEHEGLLLEECFLYELQSVLERAEVDILVCLDPPKELDWTRIAHPPRLVVNPSVAWAGWEPIGARLHVPSPADSLAQLILDVIHDDPLHECVRGIDSARLLATPISNQDLRLNATGGVMAERAVDLLVSAPPDGLLQLLEKASLPDAPPRKLLLSDLRGGLRAVGEVLDAPLQFDHESEGLGPLQRAARILKSVKESRADLEKRLADLPPSVVAEVSERLPRFVDVRVVRLEESPFLKDARPAKSVWVPADCTLRLGARYQLRLQLGAKAEGSLVVGEVPSIDGTLPPPRQDEMRELEVAVFGQGLAVEGKSSRKLALPSTGPTAPLRFTLRAETLRTAGARISLYWKKALLQSFELVATVSEEERLILEGEAKLKVTLDFSRTEDFHDLPAYVQPALALGLNADVSGGTHSLFVKGDGDPIAFRLPEAQLDAAMQAFWSTLRQATEDAPGMQRYPFSFPDRQRCLNDLWRLANDGWNLWTKLRSDQSDLWSTFDRIRQGADDHVQVTRLNAGVSFPWAAVYDWELPASRPWKYCLGESDEGAPCQHQWDSADSGGLCVRGFWGIRHRLEQLVGKGTPATRLHAGHVLLAADEGIWEVNTVLDACTPGSASFVTAAVPELLPPLFQASGRPTIYIAIGAHITNPTLGGPSVPHLKVDTRVIEKRDLVKEATRSPRWTTERPLVMLMSCNSALPVGFVVDWVQPLLGKGAAGVVATEALVYPELAVVASRVLLELLHGKRPGGVKRDLAEAMRELHLYLLERAVPLGFVFTALGDAGLRL